LVQQLEALPRKLGRHVREPGDVAARSREVRYHAVAHRIAAKRDYNRHRRGGALRRPRGWPDRDDDVDIGVDKLRREARQTIHLSISEPLNEREVLSFDVPERLQSVPELLGAHVLRICKIEDANARHTLAATSRLRGCAVGPSPHSSKKRHDLPPPQ
jgi:hypothetical protein